MATAARRWRNAYRKIRLASLTLPRSQILLTRYEDLCSQPKQELGRVLRFLGASSSPSNLFLTKETCHNIGGNPMLFRREEREIRLDETWRTELTPHDLATFERLAGRMNRSLGYG